MHNDLLETDPDDLGDRYSAVVPEGAPLGQFDVNSPELRAILGRNGYRLTPATFAMRVSRGFWHPAPHLQYVSARIASALHKGRGRVVVSFPPRHGKSELLSVWTPTWALDHNPNWRIMQTSYGAELASEFSGRVRDIIREDQAESYDLIRARLRRDSTRIDRFRTTERGAVYAAGVRGPITGRGANILLIDDYLKDAKDSLSETIRNDCWEWFKSTAMTRLEPGGSAIIIATRWNIDDIIGRCKAEQGDQWTFIDIPAIAGENDVLGRQPGEALWPERYSVEDLEQIKKNLGTFWWEALYQQNPLPSAAGLFQGHWISPIDVMPHYTRLRRVRVWDIASTQDGGDWTVGALLAYDTISGITIIEDIRRFQGTSFAVEQAIRQCAEMDGKNVRVGIEREPGSSGKNYIELINRHVLPEYTVFEVPTSGSKFFRAQPFLGAAERGEIRMMRAPWNQDMIDEFHMFPDDGAHDDQVDAVSGAYWALTARKPAAGTIGRSNRSTIITGEHATKLVLGATFGRR